MNALRILIAENDAMIGMMLAETLEGTGHVVCAIVATAADTVAAAVQHRPDLMIVDVQLAKGNGLVAVDEIPSPRPIPCVFITGDAQSALELKPLAIVLEKPFREADLLRAMKQALGTATISYSDPPRKIIAHK
jgi:CheY-like chemotaxis protein